MKLKRIEKIRIASDNLCYGVMPAAETEIFQRLTIARNGQVWLSRYCFGAEFPKRTFKGIEYLQLSPAAAEKVFSLLEECFAGDLPEIMMTDVGSWEALVTYENNVTEKFTGPLVNFSEALHSVSELIRSELSDNSVFVFDTAD